MPWKCTFWWFSCLLWYCNLAFFNVCTVYTHASYSVHVHAACAHTPCASAQWMSVMRWRRVGILCQSRFPACFFFLIQTNGSNSEWAVYVRRHTEPARRLTETPWRRQARMSCSLDPCFLFVCLCARPCSPVHLSNHTFCAQVFSCASLQKKKKNEWE